MMDARDTERLIEEALTAWRPRTPDGRILPHPAWADLRAAERERLFDEAVQLRTFEQALDAEGISPTCRAVLARIRRRG
jgi:hypothetical protein